MLAEESSGVRDGSMTMGFLAKLLSFFAQEEIGAGLHAAEKA